MRGPEEARTSARWAASSAARAMTIAVASGLTVAHAAVAHRALADEPQPQASPSPAAAPAPSTNAASPPAPEPSAKATIPETEHPTPLQVDYAQYGLAIGGDFDFSTGAICPPNEVTPCIIGSGGGLTLRGGYRPSGPWYVGGAYQFSKLDSNNLFRLGVFQQLRAEMRYFFDFKAIVTPYLEIGGGPCIYGDLWGADTGGAVLRAGGGVEFEVTRFALVGLALSYEPVLLVGYTDTTNQKRDTGLTQFLHFEVVIELRSELTRE